MTRTNGRGVRSPRLGLDWSGLGDPDHECAAPAGRALHPDAATVQLHQPLGDGQAQARPFLSPLGYTDLLVDLEDPLVVIGWNPPPGVAHGQFQLQPDLSGDDRDDAALRG